MLAGGTNKNIQTNIVPSLKKNNNFIPNLFFKMQKMLS